MSQQFLSFVVRWALNSLGLWLAVELFGTGYTQAPEGIAVFLIAGLIFSLVNAVLKPILIIFSLPALLFTLGLFMFIVNGLMVYISILIAPHISMTFWHSILAGVVIAFVNYVVSNLMDYPIGKRKKEVL